LWWVYVLRCADDSLYCGITTDIERRLKEHNGSSKGAKYTRSRRPVALLFSRSCESRSIATRLELRFKSLQRHQKLKLLSEKNFDALL
jgi:putative endonuclease